MNTPSLLSLRHSSLKLTLLLILLIAPVCNIKAQETICDMQAAREYCDREELDLIEGIWEFPEDETFVLIRKSPFKEGDYDISVISTPDCRLNPGEVIGKMESSSDADKFRLSLFCSRKAGLLTDLRSCRADFKDKEGTIHIYPKKYKIGLRSLWLLPKFWRMIRVSVDNPQDKIPRGLVRIYPAGKSRGPIYL